MNFAAIIHEAKSNLAYAYDKETLHVRIKTGKNEVKNIEILAVDPFNWIPRKDGSGIYDFDIASVYKIKMEKEQITRDHDCWFAEIKDIKWRRIKYCFILENDKEKYIYGSHYRHPYTEDKDRLYDLSNYFNYPYINEEDLYKAPDWVENTVWYQIFPKSFYGGEKSKEGTLQGIIEKLDYIKEAGFNGIYLNPIFESPSQHKYDTTDYFKIDKELGDNDTFKRLVEEAHRRGIKVMLDAVFNHCGFNHPYWQDVVKNGKKSKYFNCFYVLNPNKPIVAGEIINGKPQAVAREELNYFTFAYTQSMPKWNTSNPIAREYLLKVASYWVEKYDIDGWRLDVSNEVSHDFWRELRKRLKAIKPSLYILGENWDNSYPWLRGDQFDAVMNYEFSRPIWSCFRLNNKEKMKYSLEDLKVELSRLLVSYPKHLTRNLFNLLDSHDTERFFSLVQKRVELAKLAYLILLTFPGSPSIYYGSEIGMTGGEHTNRQPMIWEEDKQNKELFSLIKKLIQLRKKYKSFRSENLSWIELDGLDNVLSYKKKGREEDLYVILNMDEKNKKFSLPEEMRNLKLRDCLEDKELLLDSEIELFPYDYKIYLLKK